MKASDRRALGVLLTVVGWIMTIGGVAIVTIVAAPFLIFGATLLTFAIVLLVLTGTVAMGPVLVYWGEQLRFPLPEHMRTCPRCDYDLRGRPDTGCPECGWKRELAMDRASQP